MMVISFWLIILWYIKYLILITMRAFDRGRDIEICSRIKMIPFGKI